MPFFGRPQRSPISLAHQNWAGCHRKFRKIGNPGPKLNKDEEGGWLNQGAGVVVFPRADVPWDHGNTTTHPSQGGAGADMEVRGGGSWYSRRAGGGGGSLYSRGRRGAWCSRGSEGAALPVGIPRPRPPGLAALLCLC